MGRTIQTVALTVAIAVVLALTFLAPMVRSDDPRIVVSQATGD